MNGYCKRIVFFILLAGLFSFPVTGQEDSTYSRILVNSEEWIDVYSVMQYGSLIGKTANFLVSDRHATLILNQIPKSEILQIISSSNFPHIVGYEGLLQGRGYEATEFEFENVNIEVGRLLPSVKSFIIIDPSYGYNAIAVAPYAAATNSYVLFADEDNINDVTDFLDDRDVGSILIYGQTDRDVRSALDEYSPEIINEDGDRFLNNVEIVKKYQDIMHAKQAILTNGEFIEQAIMSGEEPVVFIGSNNVPEAIRNYIRGSEFEVGVLIGNELVGTATFVRRELGISVFVKFAQGARAPQGRISQVEALDMFYLPTYDLNLQIDSIKYNRATNQLEVTIQNTEDQATYLRGTYSLTDSQDGRQTVGDVDARFIDGNELKTFVYDVQPMAEGTIRGDVFVIYGESKASLEKEIRTSFDIETVTVLDNCEVEINSVALNMRKRQFAVEVENIGNEDCYVDVELVDLIIAGDKNSFGMESVEQLKSGAKKDLKITVKEFEQEDIEDNEIVKVRAFYGQRENSLIRVREETFELSIKKGDLLFYTLIIIIIILLILILWKRYKKKKPVHHVHHVRTHSVPGHQGHSK